MSKDEIIDKANEILDETKKEQNKYHEERVVIFKLLEDVENEVNVEILKNIVKIFEKNKAIQIKNEKYEELKLEVLASNIKNQKVRQEDKNTNGIVLFLIEDKYKNRYSFFTRKNAQEFINKHNDSFDEKVKIKIIKNDNIDIENLISKMI